jgi:hypothetical protein
MGEANNNVAIPVFGHMVDEVHHPVFKAAYSKTLDDMCHQWRIAIFR